MKVSELAEKYGLKATIIVADLEEFGLSNLGPGDNIPGDEIQKVEKFLVGKGYKDTTSARKVTLIKKRKVVPSAKSESEKKTAKAVAHVKKKIIIKRKHSAPAASPASADKRSASAAPSSQGGSSRPQDNRSSSRGGGRPRPHSGGSRPHSGGSRPSHGDGPPRSRSAAPAPVTTPTPDRASPSKGKSRRGQAHVRHEKRVPQEKNYQFRKKTKRQHSLDSVPEQIEIMEVVSVGDLARKMNLKANEIIAKLMQLGVMATINQQIDSETAELVAAEFGCEVKTISLYEETVIEEQKDKDEDLANRPPIVTVMGHVDHGKTKLLDAIRSADVVASESGGITQHIGAYQVSIPHGKITFLDTPGHEAFTMMRARGAKVTDIVILVVAADDGIMPQTVEAIDHALAADVPIIVAINKVDKPEANIDRVKQQLADRNLLPEDWGGTTMCVPISALKKTGIKDLLEAVLLQAEVLELKANPARLGVGTILEARVDPGKGTVATILCETGSMETGDNFVAGVYHGKIRAMFNDHGERVDKVLPAMPVEILGFTGLPLAGDPFHIVESDKRAKVISSKRQELRRFEDAKNVKKVTMDNLFERIQAGEMKELKVVIKADVQGSAEALRDALEKVKNEQVRLVCIHNSAGAINENDVMLASASDAIVVGFHVRMNSRAKEIAEKEKVDVRTYTVIYDAINDISAALTGMMAPEFKEKVTGMAEVREVFKVPKIGLIAGCYVTEGTIYRNNSMRVIRDGVELHDGKIASLKRFKDDAKEVAKGYECGIGIESYTDVKAGDILESYMIQEIKPGKGQ